MNHDASLLHVTEMFCKPHGAAHMQGFHSNKRSWEGTGKWQNSPNVSAEKDPSNWLIHLLVSRVAKGGSGGRDSLSMSHRDVKHTGGAFWSRFITLCLSLFTRGAPESWENLLSWHQQTWFLFWSVPASLAKDAPRL